MPNPEDKFRLRQHVGVLEFYFETGMEQMGCIFHDDRGNHVGPKWDNPNEMMTYRSIGWTLWFDKRCIHKCRIFDKEGNVAYEGPLSQDKAKVKKAKYRYSFLPKEIPKKDWLKFCELEYRAEIYTTEITHSMKEEYKIDMQPGESVQDLLTDSQAFVMNVDLDETTKTVAGYWIHKFDKKDGKFQPIEVNNGYRTPSEVRKFTFEDWRKLDENQIETKES